MENLFSSAEFDSPQNIILSKFMNTFECVFNKVKLIKSDYSDYLFYKSFFGVDERIIDLVNAIFIASNSDFKFNLSQKLVQKFNKIKIFNIEKYLDDLYENEISEKTHEIFKENEF